MNNKLKLSERELKAINNFKDEINNRYNIIEFKIFGSKARGESSPESDIDIMIILDDYNYKIESEIDDILFDINVKHNVFISKIIYSIKELEQGPMDESPLYKVIQREGISV